MLPTDLNRREFLRLGAALTALAGTAPAENAAKPPNIVFILTDDLGWRDLGCYGSTFHETPRLDALAQEGVRFTQFYSACPVCSPSRAAIMTGLYPARVGLTDFLGGQRSPEDSPVRPAPYVSHLPFDLTTLPEALKAHGYTTAILGKWHLGGADSPPEAHGFDKSLGTEIGGGGAGYFAPKWWLSKDLTQNEDGKYIVDRLTDDACAYLRAPKDKPFFLYLSHFAPHIPLQAKPEDLAHFEEKKSKLSGDLGAQANVIYASIIAAIDRSVGRVLDTLKEAGLEENTVVIFTSDNGGLSVHEGANTPATDNSPLRMGKGYLYEGGLRVPLIVRWPGTTPKGAECTAPCINTDFLPTLCAAAGVPKEDLPPLDGVSIAPLLHDPKAAFDQGDIFWHYPHFANQGGRPGSAIRRGDWKLIEWHETGQIELYDLKTDPGEAADVSAAQSSVAKELQEALHAWRERVGAKMPPKKA